MTSQPIRSDASARQACFEAALVVERAVERVSDELQEAGVRVELDVPEGIIVRGGFGELRAALSQLIVRALHRIASGGELTITVVNEPGAVAFEVADDGTAASGPVCDGSGVTMIAGRIDGDAQLEQVKRWADLFGGTLVLQHCPQGGSAATLRLPHTARRAAA